MDTNELALAVEAWAAEASDDLNSYEHAPNELAKAMPLVLAEIKTDTVAEGKYEQAYMRVRGYELLFMVQPGETPDETWAASQLLSGYIDTLGERLRLDPTLGGRVEVASPLYSASYDPAEMEYADGTVARVVTMRIDVGETTGGA